MLTHEPPRVPKPASQNPWYVLATIHGEQTEEGWNEEIAAKNRRIWNGWSCGHLPKAKRAELAKLAKLDEAALEAWSETERAEVEKVFATGRGMGMTLPDPEAAVDFKDTHFETPLSMSQFVFSQAAVFSLRHLRRVCVVRRRHVQRGCLVRQRQRSAGMRGSATPGSAAMRGSTAPRSAGMRRFSSATVSGDAVFNGATFRRGCVVRRRQVQRLCMVRQRHVQRGCVVRQRKRSAGTRGSAAPRSSVLPISRARPSSKIAAFSDCQFGRTTSFREARFQGAFPRFSGAILHQNTIFTANDRFWPAMSSVEPEASRDSLAVIRHAVAKQGLPEEEHYFFRREMRFRAKIGTVFERLPYILYQELSDFGNSIIRPTVGLLALWVTFGLAYWLGYYGSQQIRDHAACLRPLFCEYFRLPWIPWPVHAECLR